MAISTSLFHFLRFTRYCFDDSQKIKVGRVHKFINVMSFSCQSFLFFLVIQLTDESLARHCFGKLPQHYQEWKHYLRQSKKTWLMWTWSLLVVVQNSPSPSQVDAIVENYTLFLAVLFFNHLYSRSVKFHFEFFVLDVLVLGIIFYGIALGTLLGMGLKS